MTEHPRITFPVTGLSCASCVSRAEKAISVVEGVEAASVNLATGTASVTIRDGQPTRDIAHSLEERGYPARTSEIALDVTGMSCASCVGRVEKALAAVPGVVSARANLADTSARVTVLDGSTSAQTLADVVTKAGYAARPREETAPADRQAERDDEIRALRRDTVLAAALTAPVFLLEMGGHFIPGVHALIGATIGHGASWALQFVLTTLVLVGPGRRFFVTGIPALLRGAPEMNALVALGTLAAWSYSTAALIAPGAFPEGTRAVYFEAAAVITTLILLGRYFEARAKGRTGAAVARLVGLRPDTAEVERDGAFVEVPLAELKSGDTVRARAGARIAVDGEVIDGTSYVDEAMISGEPEPVAKAPGDALVGGTVNGNGVLTYRATAVGEATVLARIIRMVEEAQGAKLPIQSLVDKITGVFVPVVMATALLTALVWAIFGPEPALPFALVAGVSVLIIACPCAMGLATPTSVMVGTGRAAELGVLFRRGDALQGLQAARVIAFDKTGTLTEGRPELTELVTVDGADENVALAIAAAVEAQSEHPIAQAILRATEARGIARRSATGTQSVPGMGVSAQVDGRQVRIGAPRYLEAEGIDATPLKAASEALAGSGQSVVQLAVDGAVVAVFAVSDPIKSETPAAIAALHSQGLKVAMITGDNAQTAQKIASVLGIDHVTAGVMPDGKVKALSELRDAFGPVAFVGDGINDAPALAEADTGIAIGTGTDIAIEAADVVLMSGALSGVVNAVAVSRATLRNIRQNLFWAFAYNIALIPVAAGLLYPIWGVLLSPMLAAGAMAASSVLVVSNALRLRRLRPALSEGAA